MLYSQHLHDPKKIWITLSNLYEVKTASRRLLIRSKLTNLKMEMDTPMKFFLEFVTDLLNQLADLGEKIVDVVVEMVINTLPKSYEYYVQAILSQQVMPTLYELTSKLLHEETKRELCGKNQKDT